MQLNFIRCKLENRNNYQYIEKLYYIYYCLVAHRNKGKKGKFSKIMQK